jgi:hypothetical protein
MVHVFWIGMGGLARERLWSRMEVEDVANWLTEGCVVGSSVRIACRVGPRGPRIPVSSLRAAAIAIAISFAGSACSGSSDTSGPDPVTVRFKVQPAAVEARQAILPAVEIETNSSTAKSVRLALAGNDCGATLSGNLIRTTVGGVATFPDLALNIPATGYRLEAQVLDQRVQSSPFDVLAPDIAGPLDQHASICLTDYPHSDASSLAWVPRDDVFWTTDDNKNKLCALDRRSGACLNVVSREDLLTAFPDAADCDDGDGDPTTSCSYTSEFETTAFEKEEGLLYVINTVNDPTSPTIVDRPAVFRMRPGACRGCVEYDSWKPLPDGYTYLAAVGIDGQMYISNGANLHAYDFDSNTVTAEPAFQGMPGIITGLSSQGQTLYALTSSRTLVAVNWDDDVIESTHDLSPVGIQTADGLSVVRDSVYVLEGEPLNPIYVVTVDPDD